MPNEEIDLLVLKALEEINLEINESHDLKEVLALANSKILELKKMARIRAQEVIKRDLPYLLLRGISNIKEVFLKHLEMMEESYNRMIDGILNDLKNLNQEELSEDSWLLLILDLKDLFTLTLYIYYPRVFIEELDLIKNDNYQNDLGYQGK